MTVRQLGILVLCKSVGISIRLRSLLGFCQSFRLARDLDLGFSQLCLIEIVCHLQEDGGERFVRYIRNADLIILNLNTYALYPIFRQTAKPRR